MTGSRDFLHVKFAESYMSDSKWRKALKVIAESGLTTHVCLWKLVDEPKPRSGHIPDPSQFYENSVGDDGSLNGPFEFRLIEWVEVPRRYEYRRYENAPVTCIENDLVKLKSNLDSVGQFKLEETAAGLRVVGYARRRA